MQESPAAQPVGLGVSEGTGLVPQTGLSPARDETGEFTILVVDGDPVDRHLLRAILRNSPYRLLEVAHPEEALALLQERIVDLVIIDLVMPGMDAREFCARLRTCRSARLVQVLVLTSVPNVGAEVSVLAAGADEVLLQPVHPALLRARIASMLRHKAVIDTLEEAEAILFSLAQAVEARDRATGGHCERLAYYGVALGRALGLPEKDLLALHRGAFLHDVGKVSVPDAILFKPGPLNEDEWRIMRQHTIKGEEICRPMRTLAPVLPIIRHHHERWDGSGYPDGLAGEQIPLLARVLQIPDIFDALTSERPYKPALPAEEALRILEQEAERGWRDPELVLLFREIYPLLSQPGPQELQLGPAELSLARSLEAMSRYLGG